MVRITTALTLFSAGISLALPQATKRQQAGSDLVGQGNGQQFITGECASAADCASGCCVDQSDGTAQCKARVVTEQSGASCDFGGEAAATGNDGGNDADGEDDAQGNDVANAADVDSGAGVNNGTDSGNGAVDDGAAAGNGTNTGNDGAADNEGSADNEGAAADEGACGAVADGDGSENVGLGDGSQFITGQCFSPADCASGCCADQGDGTARCGAEFPTENERGQTCDFTCAA